MPTDRLQTWGIEPRTFGPENTLTAGLSCVLLCFRPIEISSKKSVPFLREVVPVKKSVSGLKLFLFRIKNLSGNRDILSLVTGPCII